MSKANKAPSLDVATKKKKRSSDASCDVVWRMIRSSANDNLLPTVNWLAWLVFWTIMVGGLLAYVIL